MMAQALKDSIRFANKDSADAKKNLAGSQEKKAVAEGDLKVTSKDLSEDVTALRDLHRDCMAKAEDFESETKSRGEELAALAKAKEIIIEATGGAASFIQLSEESKSKNTAAVRFVRNLAKKHNSPELAQLASRMASSIRLSGGSAGIFDKVKGLINDMVDKLEAEAEKDATEKAFCDKELGESNAKKDELQTEVDKLSTSIDQDTAKSAKLKEEAAGLSKALANLVTSQAEMDKLRSEEKALYTTSEAETAKGLDGIKLALKTLREYYANAKSSSEGAAGGIVGLLEVCESDFSKSLAELRTTEQAAASAYEQENKENAVEKTTKEQDTKYKRKEAASLDKASAEASNDRKGVQSELDAVLEYLGKLEDKCVAKPESYEDRTAAREAEIAGLKEALQILDGEAASLVQKGRRTLRGVSKYH